MYKREYRVGIGGLDERASSSGLYQKDDRRGLRLDDIEAVRDQLHTTLFIANHALVPVQRKPTKK
jgi:hypothetical protein